MDEGLASALAQKKKDKSITWQPYLTIEAKTDIQGLWDRLDVDRKGYITERELHAALNEAAGKTVSNETVRALAARMDATNRHGRRISHNDYTEYMAGKLLVDEPYDDLMRSEQGPLMREVGCKVYELLKTFKRKQMLRDAMAGTEGIKRLLQLTHVPIQRRTRRKGQPGSGPEGTAGGSARRSATSSRNTETNTNTAATAATSRTTSKRRLMTAPSSSNASTSGKTGAASTAASASGRSGSMTRGSVAASAGAGAGAAGAALSRSLSRSPSTRRGLSPSASASASASQAPSLWNSEIAAAALGGGGGGGGFPGDSFSSARGWPASNPSPGTSFRLRSSLSRSRSLGRSVSMDRSFGLGMMLGAGEDGWDDGIGSALWPGEEAAERGMFRPAGPSPPASSSTVGGGGGGNGVGTAATAGGSPPAVAAVPMRPGEVQVTAQVAGRNHTFVVRRADNHPNSSGCAGGGAAAGTPAVAATSRGASPQPAVGRDSQPPLTHQLGPQDQGAPDDPELMLLRGLEEGDGWHGAARVTAIRNPAASSTAGKTTRGAAAAAVVASAAGVSGMGTALPRVSNGVSMGHGAAARVLGGRAPAHGAGSGVVGGGAHPQQHPHPHPQHAVEGRARRSDVSPRSSREGGSRAAPVAPKYMQGAGAAHPVQLEVADSLESDPILAILPDWVRERIGLPPAPPRTAAASAASAPVAEGATAPAAQPALQHQYQYHQHQAGSVATGGVTFESQPGEQLEADSEGFAAEGEQQEDQEGAGRDLARQVSPSRRGQGGEGAAGADGVSRPRLGLLRSYSARLRFQPFGGDTAAVVAEAAEEESDVAALAAAAAGDLRLQLPRSPVARRAVQLKIKRTGSGGSNRTGDGAATPPGSERPKSATQPTSAVAATPRGKSSRRPASASAASSEGGGGGGASAGAPPPYKAPHGTAWYGVDPEMWFPVDGGGGVVPELTEATTTAGAGAPAGGEEALRGRLDSLSAWEEAVLLQRSSVGHGSIPGVVNDDEEEAEVDEEVSHIAARLYGTTSPVYGSRAGTGTGSGSEQHAALTPRSRQQQQQQQQQRAVCGPLDALLVNAVGGEGTGTSGEDVRNMPDPLSASPTTSPRSLTSPKREQLLLSRPLSASRLARGATQAPAPLQVPEAAGTEPQGSWGALFPQRQELQQGRIRRRRHTDAQARRSSEDAGYGGGGGGFGVVNRSSPRPPFFMGVQPGSPVFALPQPSAFQVVAAAQAAVDASYGKDGSGAAAAIVASEDGGGGGGGDVALSRPPMWSDDYVDIDLPSAPDGAPAVRLNRTAVLRLRSQYATEMVAAAGAALGLGGSSAAAQEVATREMLLQLSAQSAEAAALRRRRGLHAQPSALAVEEGRRSSTSGGAAMAAAATPAAATAAAAASTAQAIASGAANGLVRPVSGKASPPGLMLPSDVLALGRKLRNLAVRHQVPETLAATRGSSSTSGSRPSTATRRSPVEGEATRSRTTGGSTAARPYEQGRSSFTSASSNPGRVSREGAITPPPPTSPSAATHVPPRARSASTGGASRLVRGDSALRPRSAAALTSSSGRTAPSIVSRVRQMDGEEVASCLSAAPMLNSAGLSGSGPIPLTRPYSAAAGLPLPLRPTVAYGAMGAARQFGLSGLVGVLPQQQRIGTAA
ncbi:hypothetical protein Agub_g1813 [Astrephomene gubernaculifera]|uniref:EF-hand domain-containing protein n=1 Tax=Astrephomene gubernaculifera TaxID=47775 RepID=A0AAD3HH55_9CHLO|nr:hypothetical protein Agub_g1813 [Astrephomene gubernaculifera]